MRDSSDSLHWVLGKHCTRRGQISMEDHPRGSQVPARRPPKPSPRGGFSSTALPAQARACPCKELLANAGDPFPAQAELHQQVCFRNSSKTRSQGQEEPRRSAVFSPLLHQHWKVSVGTDSRVRDQHIEASRGCRALGAEFPNPQGKQRLMAACSTSSSFDEASKALQENVLCDEKTRS